MSGHRGTKVYPLTKDHKPMEEIEKRRIIAAGGKIYQTQSQQLRTFGNEQRMQTQLGPHRVLPGRLSVSRTFGDLEAKAAHFGGNPNVIIAEPDIRSFRIVDDYDFILISTDGIYDTLNNKDVVQTAWRSVAEKKLENIHLQCGVVVDAVMQMALRRKTMDNISTVMVAFSNFKKTLKSITNE